MLNLHNFDQKIFIEKLAFCGYSFFSNFSGLSNVHSPISNFLCKNRDIWCFVRDLCEKVYSDIFGSYYFDSYSTNNQQQFLCNSKYVFVENSIFYQIASNLWPFTSVFDDFLASLNFCTTQYTFKAQLCVCASHPQLTQFGDRIFNSFRHSIQLPPRLSQWITEVPFPADYSSYWCLWQAADPQKTRPRTLLSCRQLDWNNAKNKK
jgi:hypothetical protein